MPGYIKKQLAKYQKTKPKKPQHCPYQPQEKKYGKAAQETIPEDKTPLLNNTKVKRVQRVVGSILYYARAVDLSVLMALSSIASDQAKATGKTEDQVDQLLDYLASHPDATVRFHASDMILNIHSDASYLSETRARSRACGHFFLGWLPKDGEPIRLNGALFTLCTILKFVASSAAEAELGALFLNCREGRIIRLILEELGHPQPATPVHCDNATAAGIANNTVKRQRSRSMEMRYFWVSDLVQRGQFNVAWHPGQENLGDYQSKHHVGAHHQKVRPWYLQESNSPRELPRALAPKTLRGCVENIPGGYIRSSPLPFIQGRVSRRASPASTWRQAGHKPQLPKQ
jgi:hypothetical protein